jgi:hypothetical protein
VVAAAAAARRSFTTNTIGTAHIWPTAQRLPRAALMASATTKVFIPFHNSSKHTRAREANERSRWFGSAVAPRMPSSSSPTSRLVFL